MKISEIKKELAKIYNERNKWDGGKGPFTETEIRRKELILLKQYILYHLEESLRTQSKNKEFWLDIYKAINKGLKEIEEK